MRQIGQGSFGGVDYARYSDPNTRETMDVVVNRPINASGYEKEFAKEAHILQRFQHILPIARDHIVKGVSYLHSKSIVHRDLKPAKILVNNQHYAHLSKEEVDRGSPAYMAPEILLPEKQQLSVSLKDLMMFDVWAVGMICFVLANPCCKFPYALYIDAVIQQHKALDSQELLRALLLSEQPPTAAEKYKENTEVCKPGNNCEIKSAKISHDIEVNSISNVNNYGMEHHTDTQVGSDSNSDTAHSEDCTNGSKNKEDQTASNLQESSEVITLLSANDKAESSDFNLHCTFDSEIHTEKSNTTVSFENLPADDNEKISSRKDIEASCEERHMCMPGVMYNDDPTTPVFSWNKSPFTWQEIARVLVHDEHGDEKLCVDTPINIKDNVTFLVKNTVFATIADIKCDDMDVWLNKGTPKIHFCVANDGNPIQLSKSSNSRNSEYLLKGHSMRMLHVLTAEKLCPLCKMATAELGISPLHIGDVRNARSVGQLPRGPIHLYDARRTARKESSASPTTVDMQKDNSTNRQLDAVAQFCTNPNEFCVLAVDPTFNIFDTNLSLTVTTIGNLRPQHKQTGKPPVFIRPMLIHQRKNWQAYSHFAHRLRLENPALDAILACGTDGEKALIDCFRRNFRYAVFLRCFLHFKDNVERELKKRGKTSKNKKLIIQNIFGRQDGATKYHGLADCDTEREVSKKFGNLKSSWDKLKQESASKASCTFHEWFEKEKLADLITSMLKPFRIDAGLGNPPTHIKEIITIPQNDEERAVFNKGPYIPAKRLQNLAVGDDLWGQMTHAQKASHKCKFVKADMNTERKERKAAEPRWKNENLLGLMEAYKPKIHVKEPVVSVGDVVLLKGDQKRKFWKLCRIQELMPGIDGSVKSARLQVSTKEGLPDLGQNILRGNVVVLGLDGRLSRLEKPIFLQIIVSTQVVLK
eukprot:gene6742-7502_t